MKNESAFWGSLRRVTNTTPGVVCRKTRPAGADQTGTPDLIYCINGHAGVIELKYRRDWPKRASTSLKPGVTPEQRRWLEAWARAGGTGHVLYGVADRWVLLTHDAPDDIPQDVLRAAVDNDLSAQYVRAAGPISTAGWRWLLSILNLSEG